MSRRTRIPKSYTWVSQIKKFTGKVSFVDLCFACGLPRRRACCARNEASCGWSLCVVTAAARVCSDLTSCSGARHLTALKSASARGRNGTRRTVELGVSEHRVSCVLIPAVILNAWGILEVHEEFWLGILKCWDLGVVGKNLILWDRVWWSEWIELAQNGMQEWVFVKRGFLKAGKFFVARCNWIT
jgi:hypothetical protein